jgi:hypothetical protein
VPVRNPGPATTSSSTPGASGSPNGSSPTNALPTLKTFPVNSGSPGNKPSSQ